MDYCSYFLTPSGGTEAIPLKKFYRGLLLCPRPTPCYNFDVNIEVVSEKYRKIYTKSTFIENFEVFENEKKCL